MEIALNKKLQTPSYEYNEKIINICNKKKSFDIKQTKNLKALSFP